MRQKRRLEMEKSVAREIEGATKENMEGIEQAIERAKRVLQAKDDRNKKKLE